MGGCKEDDFLEKLGPQLRRKIRAEGKACPDAETLSAVLDGTAPGPVREQVMEHLMHCAECAALQTRLQAFDDVTMPESAEEWSQQQIRLDNWLEGFLRSERASRAKREGKSLRGVLTWESVSRYLSPAKLQWALGASVALLLIIGGVLLLRLRLQPVSQNLAALRQAMPQQQRVSPPTGKPAEARPGKPAMGEQPKATGPQGQRAATPSSSRAAAPPSPPQDHNLSTLTAEARVASPPRPEETEAAQPAPPAQASGVDRLPFGVLTRRTTNTGVGLRAGRSACMTCGTVVPRTVQANGQEASFGPGGTIIEIRDATRGMTIECGLHPADRKIVTEGNGRTLVSTGPTGGYLQRPFYRDRYGRSYVQRTYWVNEHAYAYAYRDLYYGVHYYRYAPAYYYHPVFYSWAFNPWAAPVHYNWGWGAAPWFYGDYFTPEPYYPTASLWLTDYLLAENLKLAYENQRVAQGNPQPSRTGEPPQPREIASTAAAPLGPEVKRMVETEVRRELEAERAAAQAPQGQAAYTDQVPPPALDPKQRLFVVSADLGVSTSAGRECELTPGDVIIRVENTPGRDAKVEVRVLSCKSRDCRVDSSPRVGVTDLQEMYNSFCERLAAGLQALANNQGKGGLPPAPDTDTLQGEVPPPVPDANAGDMLQDQRKEAMQLEAEVEQQVKMGQGLNELATSPAAVPTAQGADNRAAASSQSASKGAKNPNVLRVPGGHGVRRQPPMHAPVHSMGPARPATSQQQSKPAVPAPQGPHP